MIKEILFIVNYNLYESKRYFTEKLIEALKRRGILCHTLDLQWDTPKEWQAKLGSGRKPDLICSFNRAVYENSGEFFWDRYKVPFLSILVDPALYDINLINSAYSIISCVDRLDCAYIRDRGFNRVFFWPHAVEAELSPGNKERLYDVVALGSSYDPDGLRHSWQQKYPDSFTDIIEGAAQIALADRSIPFWEATDLALKNVKEGIESIDLIKLYTLVDNYIRGMDRVELIRSIKDARVHIFGGTCWREETPIYGWTHYFGNNPNVTIHPSIPFQETLEVLKQSKICLNSMPFFKDGTHERIFTGLACGCLPITTDNMWVSENFIDGKELILYKPLQWSDVNEKVNYYLANPQEREAIAAAGRRKVIANHTWDNRVEELLASVTPIIKDLL